MPLFYKFNVEVFFYKPSSKMTGLKDAPHLDEYSDETKIITVSTWDKIENEILRRFPNAAYLHILDKDLLEDLSPEHFKMYGTSLLEVKNSSIHGKGAFLKEDVVKGDVLYTLSGDIINMKNCKEKYPSGEWNALTGDYMYLVRSERTIYGFINHSRNANAFIDISTFEIKAVTAIKRGEELTIDYRAEPLPPEYTEGYGTSYL